MEKIKAWWDNTKAWFKRSETIAYARFQVFTGFFVAAIGNIDWTTVTSWNWSAPKQNFWIGVGLMINGIVTEVLRRRNMPAA